ncbi:MAG: PilZ domain-containing protein [Rhodobacter sp.]|nr:PilZ domain-containing protein [Rhodobacter sp.]
MRYRDLRKPSDRPITIRSDRGASEALVRDISASGVKVAGADTLPTGTRVDVGVLGKIRAARVVWCRGKTMGLKFNHPLDAASLQAFHRPGGASQRQFDRFAIGQGGHGFRELS